MQDNINKPSHYEGEIECIECIKASMTSSQFMGYLKGNVMKYIWRYDKKNHLEDLRKADVYLKWMIEESTVKVKEKTL